ncbi:acetyl-CoA carboxylase biotin carboxyl carrier protein [Sediminitomix flava]|uniref:Biotin carboxyl carrier protein of acetyl-CoA carboxylase n=1 Tax=Sediminitomix flava TaxID=379075 RepID=A0A315ZTP3_SEDFL|nr:acetyl-CoA carboxylase biotin carboxyl carrier protein [Sediminitomix flava]PWJ38604.1 acetyl-CoA carboxylase biotin carboxyl carrier protein [Sediminitomix flava]
MNALEIKDLISFIANSGLNQVNLETSEIKLHIKRDADTVAAASSDNSLFRAAPAPAPVAAAPVASAPVAAPVVETAAPAPAPVVSTESDNSDNYITIKSPMIGTFYTSPNPDSPQFKEVGDTVKSGEVVCIIEAMKLFNEIESEVSGKIVKILVDNATPVEYDQPLFLVDPS